LFEVKCFSSLYIGILAATGAWAISRSGPVRFSSLYIGILAATFMNSLAARGQRSFQFPLHRDPRCNWKRVTKSDHDPGFSSLYIGILAATWLEAAVML